VSEVTESETFQTRKKKNASASSYGTKKWGVVVVGEGEKATSPLPHQLKNRSFFLSPPHPKRDEREMVFKLLFFTTKNYLLPQILPRFFFPPFPTYFGGVLFYLLRSEKYPNGFRKKTVEEERKRRRRLVPKNVKEKWPG
jgi:hypothetical protein